MSQLHIVKGWGRGVGYGKLLSTEWQLLSLFMLQLCQSWGAELSALALQQSGPTAAAVQLTGGSLLKCVTTVLMAVHLFIGKKGIKPA